MTLTNRSDRPATATLGETLRVAVLPDLAIDLLESLGVQRVRCLGDPGSRDACFNVLGNARLIFTFVAPPPPPPPSAPSPPAVPEGETAAIPPGATVVFASPSLRVPNGMRGIAVTNQSDQPATGVSERFAVTLTMPEGVATQAEVVYEGINQGTEPCVVHPRRLNITRCHWTEFRATDVAIRLGALTSGAPAMEDVLLGVGCSNVVLTWPRSMPLAWVPEMMRPGHALEAIWWYWPAERRFIGYAPSAPESVNDYTATTARLEPVFICVREPATLSRPVLR